MFSVLSSDIDRVGNLTNHVITLRLIVCCCCCCWPKESLCEISRWFREEQQKEGGSRTTKDDDDDDEDDVGEDEDDEEDEEEDDDEEMESQTRIESESSPASSRDTWTPVHVEPTYGPCNRCYPRNLKFAPNNHVTPPPTPPEERDKFECLYLLVDTAISRMECERGRPWK